MYAGGLITGEALTGIILAIPIVVSGEAGILHILDEGLWYISLILTPAVLYSMYHVSKLEEDSGLLAAAAIADEDGEPDDHRNSLVLSDRGSMVKSDSSSLSNARKSNVSEQHYFEGLS